MVDTRGVVPNHNNSCFALTRPWHREQQTVLLLSCKISGFRHYKKGLSDTSWAPPTFPNHICFKLLLLALQSAHDIRLLQLVYNYAYGSTPTLYWPPSVNIL